MIQIENLKKQFGETIACDIPSFTINDGDILGLVGNNGAGKTTLFRILLDLLKADEGHVTLDGIDPSASEAWKDTTAAYIDEGFLIDFLTPEEYFAFLDKIGAATIKPEEMEQQFERFAGGEVFGQKKLIRNLSAGNKQKVGIMAALMRQPKILILDEPFNFLDPSGQNTLKHLLSDYGQATGATILVSSHNLQHTIDISTRIALLEKGKIIRDIPNTDGNAREEIDRYFEVGHAPTSAQEEGEEQKK